MAWKTARVFWQSDGGWSDTGKRERQIDRKAYRQVKQRDGEMEKQRDRKTERQIFYNKINLERQTDIRNPTTERYTVDRKTDR